MRWHAGTQGGTERIIARVLPDGRKYLAIRAFGRHWRFTF